ncbi:MAG: SDR family NAD(P)-dependent oxidoreductase, partial [Nitrososphaera sp.]
MLSKLVAFDPGERTQIVNSRSTTMQLKGTVAIVTGGNGGLGQRICHALARAGSDVAVVYVQSQDAAKSVAADLRRTGVRAEAMACDVTSPSQVQQLVSRVVDTFGKVDLLVNDAAYNKWIPFSDLDAMTYE